MKRWHNKNAPGCSHGMKDDSPDDDDTTCDEEYLKSVGESVAAMLDPMGRCTYMYLTLIWMVQHSHYKGSTFCNQIRVVPFKCVWCWGGDTF